MFQVVEFNLIIPLEKARSCSNKPEKAGKKDLEVQIPNTSLLCSLFTVLDDRIGWLIPDQFLFQRNQKIAKCNDGFCNF